MKKKSIQANIQTCSDQFLREKCYGKKETTMIKIMITTKEEVWSNEKTGSYKLYYPLLSHYSSHHLKAI